jgi:hypothetical protein
MIKQLIKAYDNSPTRIQELQDALAAEWAKITHEEVFTLVDTMLKSCAAGPMKFSVEGFLPQFLPLLILYLSGHSLLASTKLTPANHKSFPGARVPYS